MKIVVVMGGEIGRNVASFRSQGEQLAGEFFGLRLGRVVQGGQRKGRSVIPAALLRLTPILFLHRLDRQRGEGAIAVRLAEVIG